MNTLSEHPNEQRATTLTLSSRLSRLPRRAVGPKRSAVLSTSNQSERKPPTLSFVIPSVVEGSAVPISVATKVQDLFLPTACNPQSQDHFRDAIRGVANHVAFGGEVAGDTANAQGFDGVDVGHDG